MTDNDRRRASSRRFGRRDAPPGEAPRKSPSGQAPEDGSTAHSRRVSQGAGAGEAPRSLEAELRNTALAMLARRDYTRQDMAERLLKRFGEDAPVPALLDWLEAQRFLDDARYAGMLVRSRIARGQGPLRIRQVMQQGGLGTALIEQALADAECDWFELAADTCRRRFGPEAPADLKDKARRLRFLQYRGFTADQCFEALNGSALHDD